MKRQRKRQESSEKSFRVLKKLKRELSQGRRTSRVKE